MAKQLRSAPTATVHSPGYGKILFFTLLAMCGGIALVALELNEYGWQSEAKVTAAPKVVPIPPPEPAGNPAPAPVDGK